MKSKITTLASLIVSGTLLTACANKELSDQVSTNFVQEGLFTSGVEGPAVDNKGRLFAVNFGREGTIGVVDADGNATHYIDLPKGSTGNGIRFDKQGTMYVADYTGHNILKVDPETKAISVHAHNSLMNQPNDIAMSPSGIIYASDPNWSKSTGQLWMVTPSGETVLLEANMGTTNGVEVSPDGRKLYVNESVQRKVWVYDIKRDGRVSNKRLFHEFADHGLDGMRCDSKGNLYIARYGAGSVAVLSPSGDLINEISLIGKHPTNVAFGGEDGRTVYVTMQQRKAIEVFRAPFAGASQRR